MGVDERGIFETFLARSGHVMWMSGVIPDVEYVLDAYFHAHREMVEDIWVIAGAPGSLGLLARPWIGAMAATLGPPAAEVARRGARLASRDHFEALQQMLSAHLAASGGRLKLLCKYSEFLAHAPLNRSVGGLPAPDFIGGKVACPLSNHALKGDTRWTAVAFFNPQHPLVPDPYPMHAMVRVYHTTRSDLTDANLAWRRPACNMTATVAPNFRLRQGAVWAEPPVETSEWRLAHENMTSRWADLVEYSCGEEYYNMMDFTFVSWVLTYPHLLAWGLGQLRRVGVPFALQVFLGPASAPLATAVLCTLPGQATIVIVLILAATFARQAGAAVARCCRRAGAAVARCCRRGAKSVGLVEDELRPLRVAS